MGSDGVLAWRFCGSERRLGYGDGRAVEVGQTLAVEPPVILCERGLHASVRPIDALGYAPSTSELWVCRVRLSGTIVHGTDKLVATERTALWMAPVNTLLHEFGCWAAEAALWGQAVRGYYDPRSWAAIDTKRRWLRGEATDKKLDAARAVAWDVACAAAWDGARAAERAAAAWAAVWAAAERAAAWDAAWDAVWAAAERAAAWAAVWAAAERAAAWDAQNAELERRLLALEPRDDA